MSDLFTTHHGTQYYRALISPLPEEQIVECTEYVDGILRTIRENTAKCRFILSQQATMLSAEINPRTDYASDSSAQLHWWPEENRGKINYQNPLQLGKQAYESIVKVSALIAAANSCLNSQEARFSLASGIGINAHLFFPEQARVMFEGIFNRDTYGRTRQAIAGVHALLNCFGERR